METIKRRISNFDVRIGGFWRIVILEQNVLVMNKSQAENKVYAFLSVFRVDIKPFQNPT